MLRSDGNDPSESRCAFSIAGATGLFCMMSPIWCRGRMGTVSTMDPPAPDGYSDT